MSNDSKKDTQRRECNETGTNPTAVNIKNGNDNFAEKQGR